MHLDDTVGRDVDRAREGLVVVWNATPSPTTQVVESTAGSRWTLHPVQAGGSDRVVRTASHDRRTGAFTVPARTVAVFSTR
jgi:hypothetical protein